MGLLIGTPIIPAIPAILSGLALSAKRYDGSSGTAVFSGPATFQPGQMTAAGLSDISIWDGATELPITVVDSDLRHTDGSVKVAFVHTSLSAANETEVPLTLELTTTPTAGSVTATTIDDAWMVAPRLLGCTDAVHLCKTRTALGPLVPVQELIDQGLTEWVDLLTTQWDSSDSNFPCYGNPIDDFLAGTPSAWPNDDDAAMYPLIYPMYCRYLMTGNIDDLRLANGFMAWTEVDPRNMQEKSHANAAVTINGGGGELGINFDYADPPNPGSGDSNAALTEWFSGYYRDCYMGWALGGWRQAKGAGIAVGLRMKAERDIYPNGTQWAGRFDFRYIREATNYVPLYRVDEDLDYQSGAVVLNTPSPVSNWAWWQNHFQNQWYDTFQTWGDSISGDSIGRDGIWGWNTPMLSNIYPLFQFSTVFDTIYTLEQNVYQDDQNRTWDRLEAMADWVLGRTSFPTTFNITFGPASGVPTYTSPYNASDGVPANLASGADGPYTCSMNMPMMAWAHAYARDNGLTTKAANYLEYCNTMNDNRVWVVNDAGSAGNGFKQIGEMYGMVPHAAAWVAGVAHDGWDLPTQAPLLASGVTGTIAPGESVVIAWDGVNSFGDTGPSIAVFDDFSGGVAGQDAGLTDAQVGAWSEYNSPNHPRVESDQSLSGTKSLKVLDTSRSSSALAINSIFTPTTEFFLSFWSRATATLSEILAGQYKYNWALDGDDANNDPEKYDMICPSHRDTANNWNCIGNGGNRLVNYTTLDIDKNVWHRSAWWERDDSPKMKFLAQRLTPGVIHEFKDESNLGTGTASTMFGFFDNSTTVDRMKMPGFINASGGNWPSGSEVWYDDIYLATGAGAAARVEIGDDATYTSCTSLAICTPTAWATDELTVTLRGGPFPDYDNLYFFFFDKDGQQVGTSRQIT